MSSVFIPNCPAASATADISVALAGSSVDICLIPFSSSANCSSVAFTVFFTPAKALSNSIADLVANVPTLTIGTVTYLVNVLPTLEIVLPTVLILLPTFVNVVPNAFHSAT